jgi:hypothetical protein
VDGHLPVLARPKKSVDLPAARAESSPFEGVAVAEDDGAIVVVLTPAFEYSDTRFSKKLVFPWSEIISIKSNGFIEL